MSVGGERATVVTARTRRDARWELSERKRSMDKATCKVQLKELKT